MGRLGGIGNNTSDKAIASMFDAARVEINLVLQDVGPAVDIKVVFCHAHT